MSSGTESRTVILLALVANALIAVLKFTAAVISGSAAMLAEGFHSLADTGNQVFLLRGTTVSRLRPTVRHPFGRGKELYFWSLMVAVFLFVGGGVVAFTQGLDRLRHPGHEAEGLVFSLIVLGIAGVFELTIAFIPALREFNRRRGSRGFWRTIRDTKDPALLVVLFEDSVAVTGVFIAAGGLITAHYTGNSAWDGIASMTIGVMLMITAWFLAIETKGLIVGESASRADRSAIRTAVLSVPGVDTVDRLLTMHLGPDEILVNLDIVVEADSAHRSDEIVETVDAGIKSVVPEATRVFIEVDLGR